MKIFKRIIFVLLILVLIFICYFSIGNPPKPEPEKIVWGVNFSQKHAEDLGLDWQETFLAILDDLGARNLKINTQWDLIEAEKDKYDFDDLDWQIQKAKERGAEIILIVGMKTPHWPECHIPDWAKNLNKEEREKEILEMLETIVLRYQFDVWAWQVENEPFFPFGECPNIDKEFLKEEVELVRSLSPDNQIIISDTGEYSFWVKAAKLGDIVSTTLHRKV